MSVSASPSISLIIPTCDRAETLGSTIATALDQTNESLEVIVSDNASQDKTQAVIRGFSDRRLRYFNTGQRLSMCDNWEFALKRATGDYVIIIGDDDAVMPNALDRLQTAISANPGKVYTWPLHIYTWPIDSQPARVTYLAPVKSPAQINLRARASFSVSLGGWKYYELPSAYHSAIPKHILDAIRMKTGRVFHSTQPDIFTSMAIPVFATEAVNIGYSVTLHGSSAKSNGGASLAKDGPANVERYIREFGDYQIHRTLFPEVPKIAILIPDSILVAMDLFPEVYGRIPFNYDAMWAFMCRLKIVSRWTILQKQSRIRQYHPFSPVRFLFYLMLHDVSFLRRRQLNKRMPLGPFTKQLPINIRDFVKQLAAWQNNFGV